MLKIIKAKCLIDGTGRAPLENPVVVIREGRIEEILSERERFPLPEDEAEIIECPGKTLLPGLIDSHVHLAFSAEPSTEIIRETMDREGREGTLILRAARNAQAALSAGLTTLRDCGGKGLVTLTLREAIAGGLAIGPRILTSGMPITTTAGHLHWCGLQADSVHEVRKAARWLVQSGVDFIKVMVTGGWMTPGSNRRRPQYSVAELAAIVEEAHRLDKRVAGHILAASGVQRALDAGLDTFEHCHWLAETEGEAYDPQLVQRIVEEGVYVDINLSSSEGRRPLSPLGDEELEEMRRRREHARDMRRAGAKVILSTDAGTSEQRFEDFALSLVAAVKLLDISNMEAIVAATKLPAEALGLEKELGTLEVGKCADILAVDGDPLEDIGALRKVYKVFRNGQELVSEGKICLQALL